MKLTIVQALLVVGLVSLAQASLIKDDSSADNSLLPTVDITKEQTLDLDDDDDLGGSGDDDLLYEDDDDDDEEDDDYYDEDEEDEEYYDDDDDDWTLDESSGDDLDEEYYDDYDLEDDDDEDIKKFGKNGKATKKEDNDWHFADDEVAKKIAGLAEDADLLYEYYAEDYEEDYEDNELPAVVSQPEVTRRLEEDVVITVNKVPDPEAGYGFYKSNNLLVSVFVASGLASFAIFTLAFVLCYLQRRQSPKGRGSNLPFVIDVGSNGPYKPATSSTVPPSSIVKSYQRVPTSTKEFLSSSSSDSLENPSHVQVDNNSSEKPLLP